MPRGLLRDPLDRAISAWRRSFEAKYTGNPPPVERVERPAPSPLSTPPEARPSPPLRPRDEPVEVIQWRKGPPSHDTTRAIGWLQGDRPFWIEIEAADGQWRLSNAKGDISARVIAWAEINGPPKATRR